MTYSTGMKLRQRVLYLLIMLTLKTLPTVYAQKNPGSMTLTFDQSGKMLGGYKVSYRPVDGICSSLNSPTKVEVLIKSDYLKDNQQRMTEIKQKARAALNKTSVLSQLFDAATDSAIYREIVKPTPNASYLPSSLAGYDSMLTALASSDIKTLNQYKKIFPIQLMIGTNQLDAGCMQFEIYQTQDSRCNCLKAKPGMVKLVFNVPHTIFSNELKATDFKLMRKYPMKEAAIDYLKEMVQANREAIPKISNIEQYIKSAAEDIATARNMLEEYLLIKGNCENGDCPGIKNREAQAKLLKDSLIRLQPKLVATVGNLPYNCGKDNCPSEQINFKETLLGCSPAITNWLAKLVWLNGDRISLNPFGFTLPAKLPKAGRPNKESVKLKMGYYDAVIKQRVEQKTLSDLATVKTTAAQLDTLIDWRETEANIIASDPDKTDADIVADNKKLFDAFATTSQILYKGRWELYRSNKEAATAYEMDKLWLRNYYFDDPASLTRQKFHFTYPEDENIALMMHNVPGGTTISVNEYYATFKDSAAFTVMAGQAVGQITSLYASVNGISPLFVQQLNDLTNKTGDKPDNGGAPVPADPKLIPPPPPPAVAKEMKQVAEVYAQTGYDAAVRESTPRRTGKRVKVRRDSAEITFPRGEVISLPFKSHFLKDSSGIIQLLSDSIYKVILNDTTLLSDYSAVQNTLCMDASTLLYLTALHQLATSPPLIDQEIIAMADTTPVLSSFVYKLSDKEAPHQIGYKLQAEVTNKDGIKQNRFLDSSYIKVGRFHHVQFTAGLAYTNNAGNVTSVDTSGGGFKINRDEDRFRLIAGIKIYPWGLYNLKNPATLWKDNRWVHRLSVMVATGVPKPLENFYLGLGFDCLPGLTISSGMHLQQRNRYTIQNNQVAGRAISYRPELFYSLSVDPGLLVTAIKSLF